MKATPLPSWLKTWLIAVAVVLSFGGNQTAEMAGGALMTVAPAIPFNIAQIWAKTRNTYGN